MKWISLLILLFSTTAIAESVLVEWELEILMEDGSYASGIVHLTQDGELIGTLRQSNDDESFVQVWGQPTDTTKSLYGGHSLNTSL